MLRNGNSKQFYVTARDSEKHIDTKISVLIGEAKTHGHNHITIVLLLLVGPPALPEMKLIMLLLMLCVVLF